MKIATRIFRFFFILSLALMVNPLQSATVRTRTNLDTLLNPVTSGPITSDRLRDWLESSPLNAELPFIDVTKAPYGAKSDARDVTGLNTTAGDPTITSSTNLFVASDAPVGAVPGRTVCVDGAANSLFIAHGNMDAGGTKLTLDSSATAGIQNNFPVGFKDVGKQIIISGAGTGGADLVTTVTSLDYAANIPLTYVLNLAAANAAGNPAMVRVDVKLPITYCGTITVYNSPTNVTVSPNPAFTVTNKSGAIGTDNTSKFQSALDALKALNGGKMVVKGDKSIGDYFLVQKPNTREDIEVIWLMDAKNITVDGVSSGLSVIKGPPDYNRAMFRFTRVNGLKFENITLSGGYSAATRYDEPVRSYSNALVLDGGTINWSLENCLFTGFSNTVIVDSTDPRRSTDFPDDALGSTYINPSYLEDVKNASATVYNNRFKENKQSYNCLGRTSGVSFIGNHFSEQSAVIKIDGQTNDSSLANDFLSASGRFVFSGNVAQHIKAPTNYYIAGIEIQEYAGDIVITGNTFFDFVGVGGVSINSGQTPKDVTNVLIEGNTFHQWKQGQATTPNLEIGTLLPYAVKNNYMIRIDPSGTATLRNISIKNNIMHDSNDSMIVLTNSTGGKIEDVVISDNELYDWGKAPESAGSGAGIWTAHPSGAGIVSRISIKRNTLVRTNEHTVADGSRARAAIKHGSTTVNGVVTGRYEIVGNKIRGKVDVSWSAPEDLIDIYRGADLLLQGNSFESGEAIIRCDKAEVSNNSFWGAGLNIISDNSNSPTVISRNNNFIKGGIETWFTRLGSSTVTLREVGNYYDPAITVTPVYVSSGTRIMLSSDNSNRQELEAFNTTPKTLYSPSARRLIRSGSTGSVVTLPASTAGQLPLGWSVTVSDGSGNVSALTVNPAGTETINGVNAGVNINLKEDGVTIKTGGSKTFTLGANGVWYTY